MPTPPYASLSVPAVSAKNTIPEVDASIIDPDAILTRYEQERDKRVAARPAGTKPYPRIAELAKIDSRFAKMLEDPVLPHLQR